MAPLCAGACDHDDRLAPGVRAWLVDLPALCGPFTDADFGRLTPRKFDREMARNHGMGVALFGRRPCGGRDGAHLHLSPPDHAANAADEPHDLGYRQPKPEGLVMPPGIVGELRGSEAVESANAGLGDFRSSFCGSTSVNASSAMDSR